MILGVCGPRDRRLSKQEQRILLALIDGYDGCVTIAHGGGTGVDDHADAIARANGLGTIVTHADWERYGKAAGPKRNREQSIKADVWVAFVRGAGPGTKDMVKAAREAGKLIVMIEVIE